MTDQFDCLICGRPALANGEPGCDCVTHSLSRPVHPPDWEPDPADVARFPLEPTLTPTTGPTRVTGPSTALAPMPAPAPGTRVWSVAPAVPTPAPATADAVPHHLPDPAGPGRSSHSHRKPRQRTRMAAAAGGAVAAVVGCTALAASFFGGQGRLNEVRGGPSMAVPDNNPPADDFPDGDRTGESGTGGAVIDESTAGASQAPQPEGGGAENVGGQLDTPPLPDPPQPTPPGPTTPPVQETPVPDPTAPVADPTTPAEPSAPGTGEPPTVEPSDPTTQQPTEGPSTPGGEEPAPVLHLGDDGPEVVELQERLLQLNWVYAGQAHGVYDEATRDAVERFQNAYGIRDDSPGVYGAATRKALEANTNEP